MRAHLERHERPAASAAAALLRHAQPAPSPEPAETGCACGGGCPHCLKDGPGPAGGAPPAPERSGACPNGINRIAVYGVQLPGATRSIDDDVDAVNAIYGQCCAGITVVGRESWATNLLDQQAPKGVLNEYTSLMHPTVEETTMVAHAPGGAAAIHAYYVPAMSHRSRGEAFDPATNPAVPKAVAVSDSAAVDTLAHELAHVVLNAGHAGDAGNLLAAGKVRSRGVDRLTPAQCAGLGGQPSSIVPDLAPSVSFGYARFAGEHGLYGSLGLDLGIPLTRQNDWRILIGLHADMIRQLDGDEQSAFLGGLRFGFERRTRPFSGGLRYGLFGELGGGSFDPGGGRPSEHAAYGEVGGSIGFSPAPWHPLVPSISAEAALGGRLGERDEPTDPKEKWFRAGVVAVWRL